MKTNRLKVFLCLLLLPATSRAGDLFSCVRDMIPITVRAEFRAHRKDFANPFFASGNRYLVIPATSKKSLDGFFVYDDDGAHYYDAVKIAKKTVPLADLHDLAIYDLVAQPEGLETVTLHYLPGFHPARESNRDAGLLGGSVLPVVGAMVTIQRPLPSEGYYDPMKADVQDVRSWVAARERMPASVGTTIPLRHQIVHLVASGSMSTTELWEPLHKEFKLRRAWIQSHNLDKAAFRELSSVMRGSCHDVGVGAAAGAVAK